MPSPRFTLLVAASADGFIARAPGHAPSEWCSPEEQADNRRVEVVMLEVMASELNPDALYTSESAAGGGAR